MKRMTPNQAFRAMGDGRRIWKEVDHLFAILRDYE